MRKRRKRRKNKRKRKSLKNPRKVNPKRERWAEFQ